MPPPYLPSLAGAELFGHLEVAPISSGAAKAGPVAAEEYRRDVINNVGCMVAVLVALAIFQFTPKAKLSDFCARKLTHVTMGTLLLLLKPEGHSYVKIFIIAVAVSAILSSIYKPFRFAKKHDKGVILFNAIVGVWTLFDLPCSALAPMFYADPCGAIVGTMVESPKWKGNKTIAGSAAVFVVTLLSAYSVDNIWHRIALAALCTILEAVGGDYDNVLMSFPVIAYYFLFQHQRQAANDIWGGLSMRGGFSSQGDW
ncbi:phosphatidate cytidylyltransferase [Toxoplasma gondii CAST]|uniref:Phosphatidate cytidylyltransferase n=1 Tax=Toxoplasma gondii CAST TaxID=943122 RepID=A0A3R8BQT0_TOXGO|nr:phosphatidate cytidylyltransferase [Toxoplasma gondii CAST]